MQHHEHQLFCLGSRWEGGASMSNQLASLASKWEGGAGIKSICLLLCGARIMSISWLLLREGGMLGSAS